MENNSLLYRIVKERMTGADLVEAARTSSVDELIELGDYTMKWFATNPNSSSEITELTMFVVIKELASRGIESPWPQYQEIWRSLNALYKESQ